MTEGNINQPETPAESAEAAKRASRRRLIKAALLAAPLIVTLRGKPAHAQLSALGSVNTPDGPITYGPGAYVTSNDVEKSKKDSNPSNDLDNGDIGKAIKRNPDGKWEILEDKTRRSQKGNGKVFDR